jgi:hypothetical protein
VGYYHRKDEKNENGFCESHVGFFPPATGDGRYGPGTLYGLWPRSRWTWTRREDLAKMKLLLCFAFAAIVIGAQALTDEQIQKRNKISKECQQVSGVSQETIDKVRTGVLVDDPKMKKHVLCFSKKTGVATEAGDTNVEVLKAKLKHVASDEEVDKIVQKCVVKKATPEETAYDTFKCIYDSKPDFSPID